MSHQGRKIQMQRRAGWKVSIIDFQRMLSVALKEFARYGLDSEERLNFWLGQLRVAANAALPTTDETLARLRRDLGTVFKRATSHAAYKRNHPALERYARERVGARLDNLLQRRIMAGVDLIKLNRDESIEKVLRRFSGLVTSIPEGGSNVVAIGEAKKKIAKSLRQMSFEERRVVIDQGHKLNSAIQRTVADGGGAIAAIWHSHWRQAGYNFRPDHKERDEKVYTVRDNWAIRDGLMKAGPAGYTDEITQAGEEVLCRCYSTYLYNIRELPADMLTEKGAKRIKEGRSAK